MSKKKKTLGIIILTLILMFLLWPRDQPVDSAASQSSNIDYPDVWNSLRIPAIPGSTLKEVNGSDLEEGIGFEYEINLPASQVGNYYEEQFEDRNFDNYGSSESGDNYANGFSNGDFGVDVDVIPDPANNGRTRVRIWIERERKSVTPSRNALFSVD